MLFENVHNMITKNCSRGYMNLNNNLAFFFFYKRLFLTSKFKIVHLTQNMPKIDATANYWILITQKSQMTIFVKLRHLITVVLVQKQFVHLFQKSKTSIV